MLRSFRLGNHRSFRDEQELLLIPVYAKERSVLPVAAIYGANASGKSNLLDGLKFMADAVRDSFSQWRPEGGVPRRPFKLDPVAGEKPSVFVVELVQEGVRYTYGFEVDDQRIVAEWLYSYPEKRKRVLFDRTGSHIKFGKVVADSSAKVEVLESLLRPNALFLSLAAQSNVAVLMPVYRWFVDRLVFRTVDHVVADLETRVIQFLSADPSMQSRVVELLRAADLGISDMSVKVETDELRRLHLRELQADVAQAQESLHAAEVELGKVESEIEKSGGDHNSTAEMKRRRVDVSEAETLFRAKYRKMLVFQSTDERAHEVRLSHGVGEGFRLDEESAGTLSWLSFLPTVLTVLRDGGVLIIDEIDASLHSLLSARLVALFNDPETNPAEGQLIFTTHDSTLLHPPLADRVLDRDEVWFVEKGRTGASVLYPLTDFKPRQEDNLERRYLAGQYGAVPDVYEELFARAVRGGAVDDQA